MHVPPFRTHRLPPRRWWTETRRCQVPKSAEMDRDIRGAETEMHFSESARPIRHWGPLEKLISGASVGDHRGASTCQTRRGWQGAKKTMTMWRRTKMAFRSNGACECSNPDGCIGNGAASTRSVGTLVCKQPSYPPVLYRQY